MITNRRPLESWHFEKDRLLNRNDRLIAHMRDVHLIMLAAYRGWGWISLYRDPSDGSYWEQRLQEGGHHGGGPASLFPLSTDEVLERYTCLPTIEADHLVSIKKERELADGIWRIRQFLLDQVNGRYCYQAFEGRDDNGNEAYVFSYISDDEAIRLYGNLAARHRRRKADVLENKDLRGATGHIIEVDSETTYDAMAFCRPTVKSPLIISDRKIVYDAAAIAINHLVDSHLERVGSVRGQRNSALYHDPFNGACWVLSYPNAGLFRKGPASLTVASEEVLREHACKELCSDTEQKVLSGRWSRQRKSYQMDQVVKIILHLVDRHLIRLPDIEDRDDEFYEDPISGCCWKLMRTNYSDGSQEVRLSENDLPS